MYENEQGPSYNVYFLLFFLTSFKDLCDENFIQFTLKQRDLGLSTKAEFHVLSLLVYGTSTFIDMYCQRNDTGRSGGTGWLEFITLAQENQDMPE